MDEELKKLINEAYENILHTSNKILRNCRLFTIEVLQQEDPTYEEIAEHLHEVAGLIGVVQKDYPKDADGFRTATKAREYAQNIANIAGAIRLGDKILLEEYLKELERRPFV